jgi:flagellar basal body-associated protein FliL
MIRRKSKPSEILGFIIFLAILAVALVAYVRWVSKQPGAPPARAAEYEREINDGVTASTGQPVPAEDAALLQSAARAAASSEASDPPPPPSP